MRSTEERCCRQLRFRHPLTPTEPNQRTHPESIQRVRKEEVAQRKDPKLPTKHTRFRLLVIPVLVRHLRRILHSLEGDFAFLFGEEFGSFGKVGHEEEDEDADDEGGNTLEDEEPAGGVS